MHAALFIAYAIACCFLLARSRFLVKGGLPPRFIISTFLLYVAAGIAHTWIAFHYFPDHGDIWFFFEEGMTLKNDLLYNRAAFGKEFIRGSFSDGPGVTESAWNFLQYRVIAIINAAFNFLSFDNLYINTLLFCFFTMWGRMAFYRLIDEMYPGNRVWAAALAFLLPSVIFWTSVIHKEGLLFSLIGILLFFIWRIINSPRVRWGYLSLAVVSFLFVFLLRNVIVVMLVPALWVWCLTARGWTTRKSLLLVGLVSVIGLVMLPLFGDSMNLLVQLENRQQYFLSFTGGSRILLPDLEPGLRSFVAGLPYAIFNGFFMPLPGTGGSMLYNLFAVELIVYWLLIGYGIYRSIKRKNRLIDGFCACCLILALGDMLFTGYIVPFVGAIVRYRSIFFPFLLLPFVVSYRGAKPGNFITH